MNETVRVLIVEDVAANSDVLRDTFELELEDVGLKPIFVTEDQATEARRTIRTTELFDMAVVDLYLRGPATMDGLSVLMELQKRSTATLVVAITSHPKRDVNWRDEVIPFADFVAERDELWRNRRNDARAIAIGLVERLKSQGRLAHAQLKWSSEDLSLVELLGDMAKASGMSDELSAGEAVLRSLILKAVGSASSRGEADSISLHMMTSGASGAHICRVALETRRGVERYVVKIARNAAMLEREADRADEMTSLAATDAFMARVGELAGHPSGYSAICFRLADDSIELAEWILDDSSDREAIARVADVLFLDQLGKLADRVPHIDGLPIRDWLAMSGRQAFRFRSKIPVLVSLLRAEGGGGRADASDVADQVISFLDSRGAGIGGVSVESMLFHPVPALGDLHSRNILIRLGSSPRPVLIDASESSFSHWSTDAARLLIDLAIRVRKPVQAFLWESFEEDVAALTDLCFECRSPRELGRTGDDSIEYLIEHIVRSAKEFTGATRLNVTDKDWHWQWHAALLKELVRFIPYADISAPRSTAALVAARNHLATASESLAN